MSWPPPGFDPTLDDQLSRLAEDAIRAQRQILEIDIGRNLLEKEKDRRVAVPIPMDDLLPKAKALVDEANRLNQPESAARAGMLLGEIYLAMKQPHEALATWKAARKDWNAATMPNGPTTRDAPRRAIDIQFLEHIARAFMALKDPRSISETCGEAITLIEIDRDKVSSPYLQAAFLKHRASLYRLGVYSAFQLGDYETLLARAELAKARLTLRFHQGNDPPPADSKAEQRFRELCDAISARNPRGNAKPDPKDSQARELDALQNERRRLWDRLAIARFRLVEGGTTALASFSIRAVQESIEPDEAIVYYYGYSLEVLLVIAIDRNRLVAERVELNNTQRATLNEVIDGISDFTGALDDETLTLFDQMIGDCSDVLLPAKVAAVIEGKRRLILSPHQRLHLFPLHALKWKDGFLIEGFAVSYVPNLSLLLAPVSPASRPKVLLGGVGTYGPGLNLPTLKNVKEELEVVAEAYHREGIEAVIAFGEGLTHRQLSRWREEGTLADFSCIHLATHGVSVFGKDVADTPMESRLYLFDAALDGLEISQLNLRADLVVLSACNSGQRAHGGRSMDELPGDDLFGLGAAFAMAGARSVLGCLWPVKNTIANEVMVSFHRYRSQYLSDELALQRAIGDYLRQSNDRHCFWWAPFFLTLMGARTSHPRKDRSDA